MFEKGRDTERVKGNIRDWLWQLCCLHNAWLGMVGIKCGVSWPELWPDFPTGQQIMLTILTLETHSAALGKTVKYTHRTHVAERGEHMDHERRSGKR